MNSKQLRRVNRCGRFASWSVLVLTLCVAHPVAADDSLLRWKFAEGQKLRLQITQSLSSETTVSNKPVKMNVDLMLEMGWLVDALDADGNANITQTFRRVTTKLVVPMGGTIEFDSAAAKKPVGEAKEIAALVMPLIGNKLTTTITPRGEVRDIQLTEETEKALATAVGGKSQPLFSKEQLGQLLRQSAVLLPEKPVGVGDKWEQPTELDSPLGKLRQVTQYVYAADETLGERRVVKLAVSGQLELTGAKGLTIKDQQLAGTCLFDNAAGRILESSLTQKIQTQSKLRDTTIDATIASTLQLKISAD